MAGNTRVAGDLRHSAGRPLALARWLFAVAALIAGIVVVGGITRLTESGLSIVEWKPVTGILPPLSHAQWQAEFAAYQRIPQYTEVNGPAGMTLAQYQSIYFWEWLHRLLGRAIGLAMALPFAWFAWRRAIPKGYAPRLFALLALIGLQGTFGWLMVRSGLSGRTLVAPHWLAIHLVTALATMAGMIWTALDLRGLARRQPAARLTGFSALTLAMLAIQLVYGALMAGWRAGYLASDWPAMQGRLVPDGIDWSRGVAAFVDDPFLIHFIHRWWAFAVVAVLVVMGRKLRAHGARLASIALHTAFGVQILLGIATVMSGMALWLAVLHQLTGAALVGATAWGAHALGARART
ncbi:COX15/CtaA family protein [Novosphingobium sp. Gsoil 351]|uniref:COX15/CtaA family protein n=1 Tax=Novosphingobium sp. Gsoil 351 TaxID=2675225 RepID=UPI0012B4B4E4|nr:COX15/CtaA family protein [Novosphingobium sp. Gsoil 351]QGN55190.1 heme A synthase [Novosphingobium sp. Gsoil 351]